MIKLQVPIKRILFLALLLIISSFCFHTPHIGASELQVRPAIVEQVLQTGEINSFTISIANPNNQPQPVVVTVQDPINQDGTFVSDTYLATDWISTSEEYVIIPANSFKDIVFNVDVPKESSSGGRYANLVFRTLQLEGVQNNQSSLIFPEIQVPVLFTIPGDINELMSVNLIEKSPKFIAPKSEITSRIEVINNGNIHNIISPKLILNKSSVPIKNLSTSPTIILPGSSKQFTINWTSPSEKGKLTEYAEVSFGTPNQLSVSESNTIYNGQTLTTLVITALATWTVMFLWPRKKNLLSASKILLKGK